MEEDFRGYLRAGERIVWSGTPAAGLILTALDGFLIPFSVLLWIALYFVGGESLLSGPPGILLLLIVIYYSVGRFFMDAWTRRKLRYAVTDRRILILRAGRSPKLTTLDIDRLPALILAERWSGRGTIKFDRMQVADMARQWVPSQMAQPQFLFIDNVRAVYEQIQGLIAAARSRVKRAGLRKE